MDRGQYHRYTLFNFSSEKLGTISFYKKLIQIRDLFCTAASKYCSKPLRLRAFSRESCYDKSIMTNKTRIYFSTIQSAVCASLMVALLSLTACGTAQNTHTLLAPPPPAFTPTPGAGDNSLTITLNDVRPLQYADRTNLSRTGAPEGCNLKQRIDRSSALAFNFDDNQSQLALKLKLDKADVESTMIRFTHKFQALKSKRERCLTNNKVQGVIGSLYNELIGR